MAIGKSFDLKNQKMTQKLGKLFGLFKDTSLIVIILNREFNLRADIIERNSSEKKYTIRWRDWKSENI